MDLSRKVQIAAEAVNSISRHDDEDMAVRTAMLDHVAAHIQAEREAMQARIDAHLAELNGG
jgi:hypothetical protein